MTSELFNKKMQTKEQALRDAALDLCGFMGVSALRVEIPDTSPPVYVYVGTEEKVKGLLDIRS